MKFHKSILFVIVLLALVMSACGPAESEGPKMLTVGIVNYSALFEPLIAGFQERMTELGYIEGVNINYVYDGRAADLNAVEGVVTSLMQQKVDLILTMSTPATQLVAQMTADSGIPVVFGGVIDPLGGGIVSGIENPGGNVTGVMSGTASHPQRIEWLLKMLPGTDKVYAPYNSENSAVVGAADAAVPVATENGVEMIMPEAITDEEMVNAINSIPVDADAFFMFPDTLLTAHTEELIAVTLEKKVPLIGQEPTVVEKGALFSVGIDWENVGVSCAVLADKIFKGASPATTPVVVANYFLTINMQTAEAIDVDIPLEVLDQADTIIR